jgi:hypothetical protein
MYLSAINPTSPTLVTPSASATPSQQGMLLVNAKAFQGTYNGSNLVGI